MAGNQKIGERYTCQSRHLEWIGCLIKERSRVIKKLCSKLSAVVYRVEILVGLYREYDATDVEYCRDVAIHLREFNSAYEHFLAFVDETDWDPERVLPSGKSETQLVLDAKTVATRIWQTAYIGQPAADVSNNVMTRDRYSRRVEDSYENLLDLFESIEHMLPMLASATNTESTDEDVGEAWMSVRELASKFGVSESNARNLANQFSRKRSELPFVEAANRASRGTKYLYKANSPKVVEIIKDYV